MLTKFYLILFILSFLIACGNNQGTDHQQNLPHYSIVDIELNNEIKCVATVRISEKVSDNTLKNLAEVVKRELTPKSELVFIAFLLPDMQVDNGAWAIAEFTPELNIRVLGQTISDEIQIDENLNKIKDFVGLWKSNDAPGDAVYRMRNDKSEGVVIELISASDPQPSEFATALKKQIKNGKTIYINKDFPDQYYIIEANGDLSAFDEDGFILRYKRIK